MSETSLENKAPALSDAHLQNIISELEAELGVARERQRDLDETRSRIDYPFDRGSKVSTLHHILQG